MPPAPAGSRAPREADGAAPDDPPVSELADPRDVARLTVLAGPTAVGKGTVAADVRARYPDVWLSVSATTRSPRPGEIDGVHYHFVTTAEFDRMIEAEEFLEWAVVHGRHRYGTPLAPVLARLAERRPALLEIDLAGARQVRAVMPMAQFVFLVPPSWAELERRLLGRGTEGPEERTRRLVTARDEMAAASEFEHVIVNDDVHRAADELVAVMGLRTR